MLPFAQRAGCNGAMLAGGASMERENAGAQPEGRRWRPRPDATWRAWSAPERRRRPEGRAPRMARVAGDRPFAAHRRLNNRTLNPGNGGDPGPIRTGDLPLRRGMLYPAELRGRIEDCGMCRPWRSRPFAIHGSPVSLARTSPGRSQTLVKPPAELRGREPVIVARTTQRLSASPCVSPCSAGSRAPRPDRRRTGFRRGTGASALAANAAAIADRERRRATGRHAGTRSGCAGY